MSYVKQADYCIRSLRRLSSKGSQENPRDSTTKSPAAGGAPVITEDRALDRAAAPDQATVRRRVARVRPRSTVKRTESHGTARIESRRGLIGTLDCTSTAAADRQAHLRQRRGVTHHG